jgi:hypothetical protein
LALFSMPAFAQGSAQTSPSLDAAFVKNTVESIADTVHREYFDPDLAARMDQSLRQWLAQDRYANAATPEALAAKLTDDLHSLSHDKHLSVMAISSNDDGYLGLGGSQDSRADSVRTSNAGVQRVEILPGNVGYLNITAFFHPDEAGDALATAMHMLRHADALILDSRGNGGGSSGTMALLASYFFNALGLPLIDIIQRTGELHYVTQAGIMDRDGKRPMYVLTSPQTWSGGEGIAYVLQERHRAEIIGETTVGAANAGRPYPINANFSVIVPNGHTVSALHGTSWEGTGVIPDTSVPASDALLVAQAHALRQLLSTTPPGAWHDEIAKDVRDLDTQLSTHDNSSSPSR